MLAEHLQTLTSSSGALSRRRFLLGAAAVGGGLAVGFRVEAADGPVQAQTPFAHTQVNPLSAYLTITPEGLVIVHSAHMDMGQGSYHGLATLVAEELEADWSQMRADGAWGNTKLYGESRVGRCHAGHRRFDRHLVLVRPLPPGRRRSARDVDCGGIEHLEGAEDRDHH